MTVAVVLHLSPVLDLLWLGGGSGSLKQESAWTFYYKKAQSRSLRECCGGAYRVPYLVTAFDKTVS